MVSNRNQESKAQLCNFKTVKKGSVDLVSKSTKSCSSIGNFFIRISMRSSSVLLEGLNVSHNHSNFVSVAQ